MFPHNENPILMAKANCCSWIVTTRENNIHNWYQHLYIYISHLQKETRIYTATDFDKNFTRPTPNKLVTKVEQFIKCLQLIEKSNENEFRLYVDNL